MSKKGTKSSKADVQSYEIGDTVLGKIRGYPPWPGRIVDPESLPEHVTKERPVNRKTLSYCIQFFPAADYSWIPAKDISKLKPHEIDAYLGDPAKRSGDLLEGYRIAKDPLQWLQDIADTSATVEDAEAEADEEDELQPEEGEGRPTSKKKKAPATTTTKKRKRDSDVGTKPSKPSTSTSKGKGGGKIRKSKAAVESEDEERAENSAATKENSAPAAKKAKMAVSNKEDNADDDELVKDPEATKVREWRHRLQKIFLSHKSVTPKKEEMPDMDALFTQIESYDKINIAYLSFSKIGKVMRHITVLSDDKVPLDSQYHFRDRAKVLVEKWQQIINASRGEGPTTTNGGKAGLSSSNPNGSAPQDTGTQSPNGAGDVNANDPGTGIADAINSSVASGPIDVNGHHENGHVNGSEY
ncbi:hypothetical protein D9757_011055 [Collybiopsis confluens]|uniref:PWWP domain-containing protein n=1 Tax=Collybiopsis confluens TaxID=2823264 RepID=A0A8H5LQL1_9AGAR|nr:hypothetical protein D9757_011055 [Collybiopsis confluens]